MTEGSNVNPEDKLRSLRPPGDDYQIRCPRLGHQIAFSYCRFENNKLPCFKTLDCWFEHFAVDRWLREELTGEEWRQAFGQTIRPKIVSLIDLIEQAQKVTDEDS